MYFGKDGKAASECVQNVNGVNYLFGWKGRLLKNAAESCNGKNYAADGNGKAVQLKEKWNKVGNYWYYVKNGVILEDTFETIGDSSYYFDYYGRMAASTLIDRHTNHTTGEEEHYVLDADGKAQKNQTYELWDGTFMTDASGKGVEGFKNINGVKKYFLHGKMLQSTSFTIGDIHYAAADNGRVVTLAKNGWTKVDSDWYYTDNGNLVKSGRIQISGKTYIFGPDGKMLFKAGVRQDENAVYGADGNGVMLKNSWYKMKIYGNDGQEEYGWVYFDENGQTLDGLQNIKGKKNFFFNGIMAENCIVTLKDGIYTADGNGILKKGKQNGWNRAGSNCTIVSTE